MWLREEMWHPFGEVIPYRQKSYSIKIKLIFRPELVFVRTNFFMKPNLILPRFF